MDGSIDELPEMDRRLGSSIIGQSIPTSASGGGEHAMQLVATSRRTIYVRSILQFIFLQRDAFL